MKPLPIGIQHFDKLREEGYLYIDKTEFVHKLADRGGSFFLSRPRRFGKSLFLSTLDNLLQGRQDLFDGLWIQDKWDWTRKYPIIRMSFLDLSYKDLGLNKSLLKEIKANFVKFNLSYELENEENIHDLFKDLLKKLHQKYGKVVLLIDEYDKPIIDFLEKNKLDIAIENQNAMKNLYSVLKDNSNLLHLTFITGVSKFAKVSLFSDLNHLKDLTLAHSFSTCCGYTQQEVEDNFEDYLQKYQAKFSNLSREKMLSDMKEWYNGYSWDGKTSVYNPFGLLNFLDNSQLSNYWFDTGTPTFLMHLLLGRGEYDFENYRASASFINQYSLDNIQTASLLFQTGYLTIKERDEFDNLVLDYPNLEVRDSFYQFLITYLGQRNRDSKVTASELAKAFLADDLEEAKYWITTVFDNLPYDVFTKQNESLYHGLVHILFHYIGLNVESEVHTKRGRLDTAVHTPTHVYILEFKWNKSAEEAMAQIKKRDYASKYKHLNKKIIGIGLNFKKEERDFDDWIIEELY